MSQRRGDAAQPWTCSRRTSSWRSMTGEARAAIAAGAVAASVTRRRGSARRSARPRRTSRSEMPRQMHRIIGSRPSRTWRDCTDFESRFQVVSSGAGGSRKRRRALAAVVPGHGLEGQSPDPRHRLGHEPYMRGFVAFAPVRHGRQERGVGLDQQPVVGDRCARPARSASALLKVTMPEIERCSPRSR